MRLHALVSGRVQMVGFRYHTRRKASELHLTGWVKNLPDGRVEVLAEGNKDHIQSLVAWLHHGPSHASVTKLDYNTEETPQEFTHFSIRF